MIQDATLQLPELKQLRQRAALVGGIAIVLCLAGGFANAERFFRSYLFAYVYWTGIAIGSLAIMMLHHLSGGGWGMMIRRLLEAATRTLPLVAVLFLPVALGIGHLYEWAHPEVVQADKILQHKTPYLNVPFFLARTIFYFLSWIVLAHFLNRWSRQQDETGDPALAGRMETLSGPGLVLFGATATFASFDWVMSLEPHWFSTIFGLSFMVGQVLTAFPFAIAMTAFLSSRKPMSEAVSALHFHDLGKLTLAFVMLWAYLSFSQFLIIWSGNLPEETPYYLKRLTGGWQFFQLALILFHFALPFILLLSRSLKRSGAKLVKVAGLILFMRFVDLYVQIIPAGHHAELHFHWMDLAAPIGIGGVWLSAFLRQLESRPVLPIRDPHFAEALESGH
ncbi:MAG: hypothetical protein L0Z53_05840 [Acidobacteriales bacterium]|nr:hypothetical protein [Terriglobales bacterium]MCI0620158.1 hypothetical protein [Acidobacteriota bacterium]MCI0723209.1 hypothetical protein [Acidobacteriota bacterium]